MPFIQCKYFGNLMPFGQDNKRGVSEPDLQILIPIQHSLCEFDV